MNQKDLIALLRRKCAEAGSAKAFAKEHDLSEPYLSDVINFRRDPGEKILEALNLQRIVTYEERSGGNRN